MGFDQNSIREMMILIEESKDKVKEGDWIKMTNAVKYLYEQSHQIAHEVSPLQRTDSILNSVSEEVRDLRELRERFKLSQNHVKNCRKALEEERRSVLRLQNVDKQKALQNFDYQGRATNAELIPFYDQLITSGRLTPSDYKRLCNDAKNERRAQELRTREGWVRDAEETSLNIRRRLGSIIRNI
jgi:hypothetical protein